MTTGFNSERFSHIGGADVPGTLHLWGYQAELEERWQGVDYFYGSSMRAGDWLLVSAQAEDRCDGFLCVVASVDPTVLVRVA